MPNNPNIKQHYQSRHKHANLKRKVLPHGTTELLIRHFWVFFQRSPQFCNFFTAHKSEHSLVMVFPTDQARAIVSIQKQISNKLPQPSCLLFCSNKESHYQYSSTVRIRCVYRHSQFETHPFGSQILNSAFQYR